MSHRRALDRNLIVVFELLKEVVEEFGVSEAYLIDVDLSSVFCGNECDGHIKNIIIKNNFGGFISNF
jgi:hypothetical protein